MLNRDMALVSRCFLMLLRFFCTFASHTVLPDLRLIRPFIGADTVGFDLASVQRCTTIACIAQSEVI